MIILWNDPYHTTLRHSSGTWVWTL